MYERALYEMNFELDAFQKECNCSIRRLSNLFKCKMAYVDNEINSTREDFQTDVKLILNPSKPYITYFLPLQLRRFTKEGRENVKRIITKLLNDKTSDIANFRDQVRAIERERSKYVKETILRYQNIITEIGFALPDKIIAVTTEGIKEFNQMMLKNCKTYEFVCLNLSMSIHNLKLELEPWLEELKIWKYQGENFEEHNSTKLMFNDDYHIRIKKKSH